ncbi:tripartite tricarboxylate transporter substrate binding protein (plasmid) [Variovorax sp. WS11]|nr:tripartite tricarboxylate transporter substrate binding protein [Variovorax sp. WS11]
MDTMTRLIGAQLSASLKQPVVVENRPGASGTIGADAVAKSSADGYTALVGVTSLIQTPYLIPRLPYDIFKDLSPVLMLARGANIVVVPADSPVNTLQEFVSMVKANPGKHNYGTYGNGTTAHIFGDSFNRQAGMDLVHVPFKSSSQMLAAVIGGQLSAGFPDAASALPQVAAGKLKALAITGNQRYKAIANVPTFAEAGFKGFELYGWYGVFVPAGTPRANIDKLSAEIAHIVRTPEVASRFEDLGLFVTATGPDAFAAEMRADSQVWGRAIRAGNIRAE